MSVWIQNLRSALQDKPVLILYGNVRDRYIDLEGRVYPGLNELLEQVTQEIGLSFTEQVTYDRVGHERRIRLTASNPPPQRLFPRQPIRLLTTDYPVPAPASKTLASRSPLADIRDLGGGSGRADDQSTVPALLPGQGDRL
ncbi:MAG: hypothetical protein ACRERU_19010 [Methylococcales bacterium]